MDKEIRKMKPKVAIADEAHYLKNSKAQRTKKLSPILKECKRVILLSGTPALAKPKELFSLLSCIRPDIYTSFRFFGNRYCDPQPSPWRRGSIEYDGATNVKELNYILQKSIMIRRLKKDVLSELPSKRRSKVQIQADPKHLKRLNSLLEQMRSVTGLSGSKSYGFDRAMSAASSLDPEGRGQLMSLMAEAYSATAEAKIAGTLEFLTPCLQNDAKFLVFAHHQCMMDGIEDAMKSKKVGYIRIDGKVPSDKRHGRVQQFQTDPSCKIAILSITAAGQGLTLTAASIIVFAEMHWTPAIMVQAEDRAHRIGQEKSVNCYYLYAKGTLDPKLYWGL